MNPYRIKHIPTGLYYKPGDVNLSKNGKVYLSGVSALSTYSEDYIPVHVRTNSQLHKSTEGKIAWRPAYSKSWMVYAKIPKAEFIKEPI